MMGEAGYDATNVTQGNIVNEILPHLKIQFERRFGGSCEDLFDGDFNSILNP